MTDELEPEFPSQLEEAVNDLLQLAGSFGAGMVVVLVMPVEDHPELDQWLIRGNVNEVAETLDQAQRTIESQTPTRGLLGKIH